jgi:hypothetical protein
MSSTAFPSLPAFLALASLAAQGNDDARTHSRPTPLRAFDDAVVEFDAPSTPNDRARYEVYLPKGYRDQDQQGRRHPWVLRLGGGEFRQSCAPLLDQLLLEQAIPPLVLVVPMMRTHAYQDGSRWGDQETLIARDLVAHVRERYRVAQDARGCALIGNGLGGLAALRIAIKHPETFGTVAVHGMPPLPADPAALGDPLWQRMQLVARMLHGDPLDRERWRREVPLALLATTDPRARKDLRIRIDALRERRLPTGSMTEALSQAMLELGVAHELEFVDLPPGRQRFAVQDAWPRLLAFVADGFAETRPAGR